MERMDVDGNRFMKFSYSNSALGNFRRTFVNKFVPSSSAENSLRKKLRKFTSFQQPCMTQCTQRISACFQRKYMGMYRIPL